MKYNENAGFGLEFWIPMALSILLAVWNFYQQWRLELLKKDNEKQLHIHRLQFEKEFGIYSQLWSKLIELRAAISLLRPQLDYHDGTVSPEQLKKNRLKDAAKIGNETIALIENNKPFYAEELYPVLLEIIRILRTEFHETQHGDKSNKEYWIEGKENVNMMSELIDQTCAAIRERIGNIQFR